MVVLLVMIPEKKSASDVFLSFQDFGAGWHNIGLSVMVGQVSNVFVVLGESRESVARVRKLGQC